MQINLESNPDITKEQALDPDFSLHFAAKAIADNKQSSWTSCNCYAFVKTKIKNLPRLKDIVANSAPKPGGIVITSYNGIKHLSYIKRLSEGILELQESNFKPCLIEPRILRLDDSHIVGYWFPGNGE